MNTTTHIRPHSPASVSALICKAIVALLCIVSSSLAAETKPLEIPDFTKGATIPEKAKHDWNLGPTGARGWMFCDKMVTTDLISITQQP